MLKVLMVCLGNICRSPLAEGLLKSKIDLKYRSKFIKDNSRYTAELVNSWLSTIKKSNLYRS